jgi:DNA-binding transcriptional MerR regulator
VTKGPAAFRTISEAADELGVPQHVLRFWETKFSFIRPMKRAGGRRFYRPQDLLVLRGVRALLHDEGYTIKGVQRLHKERGIRRLLAAAQGGDAAGYAAAAAAFDEGMIDQAAEAALEATPPDGDSERRLREALAALEAAKARLKRALADG